MFVNFQSNDIALQITYSIKSFSLIFKFLLPTWELNFELKSQKSLNVKLFFVCKTIPILFYFIFQRWRCESFFIVQIKSSFKTKKNSYFYYHRHYFCLINFKNKKFKINGLKLNKDNCCFYTVY